MYLNLKFIKLNAVNITSYMVSCFLICITYFIIPNSWLAPFVHMFCVITLLTVQLESFDFIRNIIFLARYLLMLTRDIKLLWRKLTRSRYPGVTNLREQRRSRSVMIMSLRP